MPNLFIPHSVDLYLRDAQYEYDAETRQWCAWVERLPGAYAQASTVEGARSQLAEVIEDYILVSLYNQDPVLELQRFATPLSYEVGPDQ